MKIGTYSVPDNPNRLPKLVEDMKKIYDTYKGEQIPKANQNDALAQLLGYKSSRNGAYWGELAALKAYGLLEGRSNLTVSEVGKHITWGTDEQKNQAALKAFLNIPLWKQLYERYRRELPTTDFWAKLQSVTNCEAPVARSNEQFITEAFSADKSLIKDAKPSSDEVIGLTDSNIKSLDSQGQDSSTQFIEVKAGPYYQRLPYTEQGKAIAKSFLDALEIKDENKND